MPSGKISIKLFDPGMTALHRVGLAGLYMTLKLLDANKYCELGEWSLEPRMVEIAWKKTARDLFAPLIEEAFGIDENGLIEFLVHKKRQMSVAEKFLMHRAILNSYLQHGKVRGVEKGKTVLNYRLDSLSIKESYKKIQWYKHQKLEEKFKAFDSKGNFKNSFDLSGDLMPGGGVRHVAHASSTKLVTTPEKFLCLFFAPVGTLYFQISHKTPEGKYDDRKGTALVWPYLKDMNKYDQQYQRFLKFPVKKFYANNLGDAGLATLTDINVIKINKDIEIDSCTIITLGTVGWSKQQKSRTGLRHIRNIDKNRLKFFSLAWQTLGNKLRITKDQRYYVDTSAVRGLIAENIVSDSDWFSGFSSLMASKKLAKTVCYERKEIYEMIQHEETTWPHQADKMLVEAVHKAIHNRYGAIAARAKNSGEMPRFNREFERIRTSFTRCKNLQTFRAELANLFVRGGLNKVLQEKWQDILPLFTGQDWQRARDLTMLALASYVGTGSDSKGIDKEASNEEENE